VVENQSGGTVPSDSKCDRQADLDKCHELSHSSCSALPLVPLFEVTFFVIGGALIYLGITKKMEPLLLVPIGFGMLLRYLNQ